MITLNINLLDPKSDSDNNFSDMRDTYSLMKLVKSPTCCMPVKGTLLDVLLTNKPKIFREQLFRKLA